MADDTTRDTAIRAESMIEQHISDCTQYRMNVQSTLSDIRNDLKSMSWKLALLLGILEASSKGIDLVAKHVGGG